MGNNNDSDRVTHISTLFIQTFRHINGQRGSNHSVAPIRNSNEELDAVVDRQKNYLSTK